ncbi:MAG: hypothetical protein Q4D73_01315 [Actinomycetaceae bacterium]|nr:hypothetical protein [Actinomycetaceae bacterium]
MRLNKVSLLASATVVPLLFLTACGGVTGGSGKSGDSGGTASLSERREQLAKQDAGKSVDKADKSTGTDTNQAQPSQSAGKAGQIEGFYQYFQRDPHDEHNEYRENMLERDLLIGQFSQTHQIPAPLKEIVDDELAGVDLQWPAGHPVLPAEYVMPILVGAEISPLEGGQFKVTNGITNPWVRELLDDDSKLSSTSITYRPGDARTAKIALWKCAWVEEYANAVYTGSPEVARLQETLQNPQVLTLLDEVNKPAGDAWRRDLPLLLNAKHDDVFDDWLDFHCDDID